ncbi:MAG: 4-hydroxy-tetrahydrodipicolinate reductase [Alphaproteobacteria bacterium]|nr:4-hydroxy-tetrahydrodipicolinate reductase [Alphaproteobacteria bacterium]
MQPKNQSPGQKIGIGIIGAAGRMGRNLIRQIQQEPRAKLVSAVVRPNSAYVGKDVGILTEGDDVFGVEMSDSLDSLTKAQVVIDFTNPESSVNHLGFAARLKLPLVIGSTGFTDVQYNFVKTAAKSIPVLTAPNFSVGVSMVKLLVELAAKTLPEWDIEIVEMHHNQKRDAPSGTALALGHAAAHGRGVSLDDVAAIGRDTSKGLRKPGSIGFAALRGGDVIGDHKVIFAVAGERVEISHLAGDRAIFSRGAVNAALWLVGKKPGLYRIDHVLGMVSDPET